MSSQTRKCHINKREGRSAIEHFPLSIEKPTEQIRYENLSDEEQKLCSYLSTTYRTQIEKCRFWPQDIIARFVTDTYYVKKYGDRLKLTSQRFEQYLQHHLEFHFDDILTLPALNTEQRLQELRDTTQLLQMYYYGMDKQGHPVLFDNGNYFGQAQKVKQMLCDDKQQYERAKWWRCRMKRMESNLLLKLSKHYGCKISQVVAVMDLKRASVSDFYTNRAFYQWNMRNTSEIFPETVHKIFIINARWIFQQIWKICSSFLDEITVQKTNILGSDYLKELVKYIDITMIPKEYGGQGIWEPRPGNVPKGFPFQMDNLPDDVTNDTGKEKKAVQREQAKDEQATDAVDENVIAYQAAVYGNDMSEAEK